jgi:hypothetical protein
LLNILKDIIEIFINYLRVTEDPLATPFKLVNTPQPGVPILSTDHIGEYVSDYYNFIESGIIAPIILVS